MENNNKVLLTVIGAATLLVAVVGATFAYFSATDAADTREVTTGTSTIGMEASTDKVDNIKPTTFDIATADENDDVEKFTLTMTGTTATSGFYTISMEKPTIEIGEIEGDSGDLSDIRYAVYQGSEKKAEGDFEDATFTDGKVTLVSNVAYSAGALSGAYTVYVWVENENAEQNNLQNLTFTIKFLVDAVSAVQE